MPYGNYPGYDIPLDYGVPGRVQMDDVRGAPIDDLIDLMEATGRFTGSPDLRLYPRPTPGPRIPIGTLLRAGPRGAARVLSSLRPGPSLEEQQADLQNRIAITNYLMGRQEEDRKYREGKFAALTKEREERKNAGIALAEQWAGAIDENIDTREAAQDATAKLHALDQEVKKERDAGNILLTPKAAADKKKNPKEGIYEVNPYDKIAPSPTELGPRNAFSYWLQKMGEGGVGNTLLNLTPFGLLGGAAGAYYYSGKKAEEQKAKTEASKAKTADRLSSSIDERIDAYNEAKSAYDTRLKETKDLETRSRNAGFYLSPDGRELIDIRLGKRYKVPVTTAPQGKAPGTPAPEAAASTAGPDFVYDPATGSLIPRGGTAGGAKGRTAAAGPAVPSKEWKRELMAMAYNGVDPQVMISWIENYPRLFDLRPEDVQEITDAGLSRDVIGALVQHGAKRTIPTGTIGPVEAVKNVLTGKAPPPPIRRGRRMAYEPDTVESTAPQISGTEPPTPPTPPTPPPVLNMPPPTPLVPPAFARPTNKLEAWSVVNAFNNWFHQALLERGPTRELLAEQDKFNRWYDQVAAEIAATEPRPRILPTKPPIASVSAGGIPGFKHFAWQDGAWRQLAP